MVSRTWQNMEAMVTGELCREDVDDEASRLNVEGWVRELNKLTSRIFS